MTTLSLPNELGFLSYVIDLTVDFSQYDHITCNLMNLRSFTLSVSSKCYVVLTTSPSEVTNASSLANDNNKLILDGGASISLSRDDLNFNIANLHINVCPLSGADQITINIIYSR